MHQLDRVLSGYIRMDRSLVQHLFQIEGHLLRAQRLSAGSQFRHLFDHFDDRSGRIDNMDKIKTVKEAPCGH